jgi:hypothetical protein
MFPDIIKSYADAMYVATTLRPPVSAPPVRESERFAEAGDRKRPKASRPLVSRVIDWLRTRRGHGEPVRPSFNRAPQA